MRLYDWKPSPFCMKVRTILGYKGLAYESIQTIGTPLVDLWRRGKIGKVPALDVDGELLTDSTDIAYELDRRFPERPVVPAAPRERALCHAVEEWADESLYFVGLYYHWCDPEGAERVKGYFGRMAVVGRPAYAYFGRLIRRQVRGQGTGRKPRARVDRDLARHLDSAEGLLEGREHVLGDAPALCDFALAAQLRYLRLSPHGGPELERRPALSRYVDRIAAFDRARLGAAERRAAP